MSELKPIVQVKNLGVNIKMDEGLLTPVRGVDFEIRPGETLGLVGESGCGKSLTSKAILAINDKKCESTGEILFLDENEQVVDIIALEKASKRREFFGFRKVKAGEVDKAQAIQNDVCRIIYKMCSGTGNLYAIMKAIIAKRGGPNCGGVRAPLANMVESDAAVVDAAAEMIDKAIAQYC